MDENLNKDMANSKIASFDRIYSTDHIRMLKICLHYIPEAFRKNLSVYIKIMELQQAIKQPYPLHDQSSKTASHTAETIRAENSPGDNHDDSTPGSADNTKSITNLIHELLPFCNPRERQQFQNIENMMNSIEHMRNMMEMMEMMKDMKDMFGGEDDGFSPDMLAGMMGMDGFDFSNMFGK